MTNYQLFVSMNLKGEECAITVTKPLTMESLLEQANNISPDGSFAEFITSAHFFNAYEDRSDLQMALSASPEQVIILTKYEHTPELEKEVTDFLTGLVQLEHENTELKPISRMEASLMNVLAVTSCDHYIDYIKAQHDLYRCHYVTE